MLRKRKLLLFLILLLASFLRFWRLGSYPALNADEAAIGYNAYSLIETGKDEHGNAWPIHFQSFNDYKPGLYFYLVLPFVKVLGLSELAVRIPGALFGVATVLVVYFLCRELFPDKKLEIGNWKLEIGEFAALFLAISPWHIHFSRGGWEVNVATFFISLGLLLYLKGLKNPNYYALCTISFVLSLYTYHAARVVVPLLVIGLGLIYRKEIRPDIKSFIISGIAALILLAPLGFDIAKGEVGSRVAGVGLFADPGPLSRINEQRGEHQDYLAFVPKAIHNKVVNYSLAFAQNYSQHFWGEFLFLTGDAIERDKVPETGQMYLFDILFLIVGLLAIAKSSKSLPAGRQGWGVILVWLLLAPTASALTFQSPHALRAQNMAIPLTVISAYGLMTTLSWLNNLRKIRLWGYLALGVLIIWGFARYQHMYWVHMAKEFPFSSQYGVKELVSYTKEKANQKIIVTDRYDQPYILFLFYLKYPPQKFQLEHTLTAKDKYGFSTVRSFGKYEFVPIDFDTIKPQNPGSLIVGTDEEIPNEANIVKRIYGTNGYLYFEAVAN
ncbi:hypothetical protein A2V56_00165 [Candidatus Woesebacteria bacterium RBG_19FT_COMBO_42_9]|uniref:Glycosyltransferase RgtA/B/C/D-like domain-containing protein n=1 Tax=Candidatus Woesebacteria bacterium RBG_16_42_24 TaxID=1802485 RepID=A0A1F7XLE2_9BACT|nr:MAG: hypothetical protein A2V97_00960 [Candidatus Woesebacteria bacterium RBG_16_42_24]OGM16647.1 MAG: hypothetical protein A2V56_00165 [Candidatus Woesebacteria bacterium RBG_19FT_COMBO_42_9]OGM68166.1 MAG: hypothetical protein A2985_04055 [Candidatus Woesebacteria bacterium RIFCSPLOWO2_01_FULL_43_11]